MSSSSSSSSPPDSSFRLPPPVIIKQAPTTPPRLTFGEGVQALARIKQMEIAHRYLQQVVFPKIRTQAELGHDTIEIDLSTGVSIEFLKNIGGGVIKAGASGFDNVQFSWFFQRVLTKLRADPGFTFVIPMLSRRTIPLPAPSIGTYDVCVPVIRISWA